MALPIRSRVVALACLLGPIAAGLSAARADDAAFPGRIDGDIGVGVYSSAIDIKGKSEHAAVLPFAYFDYGRLFARVDTLGVKTVRLGNGYLEIAGRISRDGYTADTPALKGLRGRSDSIPLGLGSLQETSVGDFFINLFHDAGKSGGEIFEVTYAARIELPPLTLYPEVGVEHLSRDYVRYYYGISPQEAASGTQPAYRPAGSLNKTLGLMAELKLPEHWRLNLFVSRKWLGNAVGDSPLAAGRSQDSSFLALSYSFE